MAGLMLAHASCALPTAEAAAHERDGDRCGHRAVLGGFRTSACLSLALRRRSRRWWRDGYDPCGMKPRESVSPALSSSVVDCARRLAHRRCRHAWGHGVRHHGAGRRAVRSAAATPHRVRRRAGCAGRGPATGVSGWSGCAVLAQPRDHVRSRAPFAGRPSALGHGRAEVGAGIPTRAPAHEHGRGRAERQRAGGPKPGRSERPGAGLHQLRPRAAGPRRTAAVDEFTPAAVLVPSSLAASRQVGLRPHVLVLRPTADGGMRITPAGVEDLTRGISVGLTARTERAGDDGGVGDELSHGSRTGGRAPHGG
jgi:hypothetical protein